MRALVTGARGFVGRHAFAELVQRGYEVDSCDLADGRDCVELFRTLPRSYVFDLVVHCAFHVGGRAAIDGEPRLLARNLAIDSALFDWATQTGQGRVLYFSSSAAYPTWLQTTNASRRLVESDIALDAIEQPDARYGYAKLSGEQMARAARESGLAVTVVRPFSGYGEDQDTTYPFRALVERARAQEDPFTIWGPGTQVRDWIHIDDVVKGALAVADSGTVEPINLCTGVGTSMLQLAAVCARKAGYAPTFAPQLDKPTGVGHRVGNPAAFHRFYRPRITLAQGVDRALASTLVCSS